MNAPIEEMLINAYSNERVHVSPDRLIAAMHFVRSLVSLALALSAFFACAILKAKNSLFLPNKYGALK